MRGVRQLSSYFLLQLLCLLSVEGVAFTNDYITITHDTGHTNGGQGQFSCQLVAPQETQQSCTILTPLGESWTVENGDLLDGNSNPIPGYSANGCGVTISAIVSGDIGDWQCRIGRDNGATPVISAVWNLRTDGELYPADTRLPEHISPLSYNVSLITDWEPNWLLDGYFEMNFQAYTLDPLNGDLYLHINDISVDESSVTISSMTGELPIVEHIYDFERDFWIVRHIPPDVDASYSAMISAEYTGHLRDGQQGFYRDFYTDVDTGARVYMAVTQFETRHARRTFPCMDEPDKKASFISRVGHPDHLSAQSNMAIIRSVDSVDGYANYVWTEFESTPMMSPYLVAYAVSDFTPVVSTPLANGVEHTFWTRPDAVTDGLAEHTKSMAPAIIAGYEQLLSVSYPLPKLEQITPPSKPGAMENWGLITYTEIGALIDVDVSSCADEWLMTTFQTHEIAHHWFGDLVTCDWWQYLWLNEGFATYMQYNGGDIVAPHIDMHDTYMYYDLADALSVDGSASSHEMSLPISAAQYTRFDTITYSKAASIIRMTEHFLKRATWLKGITSYLNAFQYATTVPDDLFMHWDQAAAEDGTLATGVDVKTVLDTWTLQKNYPLVTVTRDYTAQTATLRQERFLESADSSGDPHDYQWWIPITFSSVGDEFSRFDDTYNYDNWFPTDQTEVTVTTGSGGAPVVFNIQFTGFYRTNYDQQNWDRIAAALASNHGNIHRRNRAQLITDSYEIAKAGYLTDYSVANDIAAYLPSETEPLPLYFAYDVYADLQRTVVKPDTAEDLQTSLEATFAAQYSRVGMTEPQEASNDDNFVQRIVIWGACQFDQADCVRDAESQYSSWMSVPSPDDLHSNPVNRHARDVIYCTAIRNGGSAEYTFLEARSGNCRDPQETYNINSALSCGGSRRSLLALLDRLLLRSGEYHVDRLAIGLRGNENGLWALHKLVKRPGFRFESTEVSEKTVEFLTEYLSLGNDRATLDLAMELSSLYHEQTGLFNSGFMRAIEKIKRNGNF